MSQERPWFKSYPQGVPHEVDLEQYRSIVSVFDEAISKYRDRPAFRNFGKTLTYGEIDKLRIGITSTMAEMFIDNLRVKTHRGVKAQVQAGKSGGGRSYGYDIARASDDQVIKGELVILAAEAEVIRRIFRDYAKGISPVKIAAALNAEGIPSPRARAGSGHWKQNTINGNRERGTGILNNELYIGQRIWNRLQYRKEPETSKRVSRLRPRSEWLTQDAPELLIVDQDLWDAVKERQGRQIKAIRKAETGDRQGLGARGLHDAASTCSRACWTAANAAAA